LFEAAAQSPDGGSIQLKPVRQLRDNGVRLVHLQQDAGPTSDALLDASVSDQSPKVGNFCW
jgi:hypothetical protein